MRIVFMGTPRVAVTAFEALLEGGYEVVAAVAQPDKPAGRGRSLQSPPMKLAAESHGLPVLQPSSLKTPQAIEAIAAFRPEVLVVVSYGKILPPAALTLAPYGAINLHFSLLPKWRGAAPVQRCIAAGETRTGVCSMAMDEGLDTGDILIRRELQIEPEETSPELEHRLALLGGEVLCETLRGLQEGGIDPTPQDDGEATWAKIIEKQEGLVDWSKPAQEIYNLWRAFQPWPGLTTHGPKGRLLLEEVSLDTGGRAGAAGEVLAITKSGAVVACGEGAVIVSRLRPEGRKGMDAKAAANGRYLELGTVLGTSVD